MAPLNLRRLLGSGGETMVFLDLKEARAAQAAKAEELRQLAVKEAIQPSIFSLTSGDDDTDIPAVCFTSGFQTKINGTVNKATSKMSDLIPQIAVLG